MIKRLVRHDLEILYMILLCCRSATGQLVFDDGQEHVLTENADSVVVTNESKLDLQANVLDVDVDNATLVQNAGEIGGFAGGFPAEGLTVRNGSNASLNSGTVRNVDVDNATLVLNGGEVGGWDEITMRISNGSNVFLNSGTVSSACFSCSSLRSVDSNVQIDGAGIRRASFRGASTAVVKTGDISGSPEESGIDASGTTEVTISGGSVRGGEGPGLVLFESATLQLSGGVVVGWEGISARDESVINMSGGTVTSSDGTGIYLSGTSQLNITGGQIDSRSQFDAHIFAAQDSRVTIHGSNFNFPMFEPIELLEGEITGTLADGSSMDWRFRRAPTATITLVPEPSSQLFGLLGALGLLLRRRGARLVVRG